MNVGTSVHADTEKLAEALRLCQLELASLQQQHETLLEERNVARRKASVGQKKVVAMSRALAEQLSSSTERSRPTLRALLARLARRGGGALSESEAVAILEASPLFLAPWYLRQNADVVEAGINPALHYLREGAAQGRNPGTRFNTKAYLAAHPGLLESGMNPLIHHIQRRAQRGGS